MKGFLKISAIRGDHLGPPTWDERKRIEELQKQYPELKIRFIDTLTERVEILIPADIEHS